LVLTTGETVVADEKESTENVVAILKENKFKLSKCKNGPRKMFVVDEAGKSITVFMGDVNDLLNIECLYLMDAVVSVGKFSHVNNVARIFDKPERNSKKIVKKMSSPFKNKKMRPSEPEKMKISKNLSVLTFKVGEKKVKKSLLFYHIFKKNAKSHSKKVFRKLAKRFKSSKGNVLYLVDHLQEKSLSVFKHMLRKYAKYTNKMLVALKYKKMNVFK